MDTIGRYTVVRKLATGGMAEVFLGRIDGVAEFRKRVVIKRILPQLANIPEFVEMFLKEARLAALLEHPNLASVFDLGTEEDSYHLVMEYVEGTSLLALIHAAQARHEFIPLDRAIWIVMQVLEGLSYAHALRDEHGHALQLIHRDVSPENVLLSNSGSVKLADFGLAKAANHPRVTRTGAFKGKLHYLAPEMVHTNHFDLRVDLFSAGVVLFEAITNAKPFSGPTPNDVLDAVLHNPPPALTSLRPGLPMGIQAVVDRALAKDPAQRYATARAMQIDLDHALREMHARPGPAEIASLLAHVQPPSTAKGNEPAHAPVDPGLAPTRPPSRRGSAIESPVLPPSPFIPISSTPPPARPASDAGNATIRVAAYHSPDGKDDDPGTGRTSIRRPPGATARRPPTAKEGLLLDVPPSTPTQLGIRAPDEPEPTPVVIPPKRR